MQKMSKSQQNLALVFDMLLKSGFALDGKTKEEIVRIPTTKSPLFGKSGGELSKFGGRQRFVKTGTNIRATVGAKTTYIYFIQGAGKDCVKGIASHDTGDIEAIRKTIQSLEINNINPLVNI